jgi:ATP-binding cassette subfamily G (WHITE) protein 2 (SNQ2)
LVGFLILLFIFTEVNTTTSTDTPVVMFKRGSRKVNNRAPDMEMADMKELPLDAPMYPVETNVSLFKGSTTAAPPMTDIFSWQNINYVVPVKEGERKLLDNVSGYVAPGTLTALMYVLFVGDFTLALMFV